MEVQKFNERPHTIGETLLSVRDLCEKANSVRGISFDLHKGEIIGLAGLVGAGQNGTLQNRSSGDYRKKSGKILLNGKEIQIKSPSSAVRQGIAFVAEERRKESVFSR